MSVAHMYARARVRLMKQMLPTGHVVTGVDVTNFYETMTVRRELFL